MMSLQELSTSPASLFQCFIVFPYNLDVFWIIYSLFQCQFISMFHCISIQTRCFLDYLHQKMIDFVWRNNETLKWRVDDPWSGVMNCSEPRLSDSQSSLLGMADAGTLKHDFVTKIWRNWNIFLEYSSKHSRNTETEKKSFGHIDTLRLLLVSISYIAKNDLLEKSNF